MFSIFGATKEKADQAFKRGFETGDFQKALGLYSKLVEKEPNDYESLHNIGYIYLLLNRAADAAGYFVKANEVHESPIHWNNLGRSYQQMENFPEAYAAYERAMQLDPGDPQPWYNLTVCLREMGKTDESMAELQRMLQEHPAHAGANNDLALHYDIQGSADKAIPLLEKTLEANPDYAPSRMNLARMLCERGDFPASKEHLEYLAQQGAHVEVSAQDGQVKVLINGSILFEGPSEP